MRPTPDLTQDAPWKRRFRAWTVAGAVVASRGVAIGQAARMFQEEIHVDEHAADAAAETQALRQAVGAIKSRLDGLLAAASGERQTILSAHVELIQDPELLMLDEPVAGMSARERELTGDLLRRICANRSVIVIEHDMEFVKSIAHRVTVLHQGKILKEGSMEAVQKDPKVIEVYLGH